MDERMMQFRVGVIVLATVIIAGILVLLLGEVPSLVRGTYTVHARFSQVPGVAVDSPVRKNGILVGRVTNIELDDTTRTVIVSTGIDAKYKLYHNEVIWIRVSLLGDAELQILPGTDPAAPSTQVQDGDEMIGKVGSNPLESIANLEGDVKQAIDALTGAGEEVGKLARRLNDVLGDNDDQFQRIAGKTEQALDSFQTAMGNINDVFGDERVKQDLQQSLGELPALLKDTHTTIEAIQKTMTKADRNLENLEGFTEPLGQKGKQLIANIDSSVAQLDELLAQFVEFSRSLNNREGSLGRLVHDRDVYDQIHEAAANINQLTRELKPIVRDARVFSDKIARHPGVIVRDAVRPGAGIK